MSSLYLRQLPAAITLACLAKDRDGGIRTIIGGAALPFAAKTPEFNPETPDAA